MTHTDTGEDSPPSNIKSEIYVVHFEKIRQLQAALKKNKKEIAEETGALAAAEEISTDAPKVAVLSKLDKVSLSEAEQRRSLQAVLHSGNGSGQS